MHGFTRCRFVSALNFVLLAFVWQGGLLLLGGSLHAQPAVVPTAEGQIGETPGVNHRVIGARLESIRGVPGDILLGGLMIFGGPVPPPPEFSFIADNIQGLPMPVQSTAHPATFNNVVELPPSSAQCRNQAGSDDFVAFSTASDGSAAHEGRGGYFGGAIESALGLTTLWLLLWW